MELNSFQVSQTRAQMGLVDLHHEVDSFLE